MAKEKIITSLEAKRSIWSTVKDFFANALLSVKWFFYTLSIKIHGAYRKVVPEKQKSIKSANVGAAIFAHIIIAYPLLQFLIFYVYVNFNSILLSFQEYNSMTSKFVFGEDIFINFKEFFNDIVYKQEMIYCLKNSLIAYVVTLVVSYPVQLTFSYVIYKKIPASTFFQVILFLPSILSSVVVSMMFEMFVQYAVPEITLLLFGEPIRLLGEYSDSIFGTMLFYSIWAGFGGNLILYYGAMSRIPDSIIEYGELEGITHFKEFMHVVLPMVYSTITIFLVTGVAGIFTNQLALYNFFGENAPDNASTLGYEFFVMVLGKEATARESYPYASAGGLMFTLVAAPITLFARWAFEKYGPSVEF